MASSSSTEEQAAENFYDRFGYVILPEEKTSARGRGGYEGVHGSFSAASRTKCNYMWLPRAKDSVFNGTRRNDMEYELPKMGSYNGCKPTKVDSKEIWPPDSQGEPTVIRPLDIEANNKRLTELSLHHSAGYTSLPNKANQYVWRKVAAKSVSSVNEEDNESYALSKNDSSVAIKQLNLDSISKSDSQRESSIYSFSKNGYSAARKPLNLDSPVLSKPYSQGQPYPDAFSNNDFSMMTTSKANSKREPSTWCSAKYDSMHKDMEDFLFKMLGEGFQLARCDIRDILEKCGYDMPKCMDRISKLPAATLANQKRNSHSEKFRDSSCTPEMNSPQSYLQNREVIANHEESDKKQKDIERLQNEIWYSLFDVSIKYEESPEVVQPSRKAVALGKVVSEPFEEPTINENFSLTLSRRNDNSGENDNYQNLSRAVMEHRTTMREYYRDAITAFSEGDYAKAETLLKQGTIFKEKAVEAEEEIYKELIETRDADRDNEMLLDLHEQGAKESVYLLKCHLSSLAGIPTFKYLNVIIEKNEDVSKGARRRRVLKLLQRESIEWSEGDPGTILLDLEKINPAKLSFVRKKK